ncbi:High-affinity branched-chain amino acid transport ATP-binding protein LivF [bacterium HR12]|nr:High-affinity branched-chain amino acid transport ATP-binding protein LivF [bacterium HR12]
MLRIRDVTSSYGDIQILRGVSLDVGDGEIVALLGPNGHGKSTLLKAIAGVHPATGGSIELDGEEIRTEPPHRIVERGVAYIPEERFLFPEMTVFENLRLGAYTRRARERFDENLAFVYEIFPRLRERRDQACQSLSGGESRMVAIARGLMSGARLLLVDEPSIGLAPALKKDVYEAIRSINQQAGISVLLVEQEIEYALRLASRAYLLKKGAILFERPVSELDVAHVKEAYF